ncbi:hypothetical protein [Humidesulfovibrio idahonensis]
MSNLAKILCLVAFAVVLGIWTLIVLLGKADAGPLVNFLQSGAMAGGAAILALINPQGALNIFSEPLIARTGKLVSAAPLEQPTTGKIEPIGQPLPGFDKPGTGGFIALDVLGSVLLAAGMLIGIMAFAGCGKVNTIPATPYAPPAVCTGSYDNATGAYLGTDSEILKSLPNPTGTGVVLQLANYAAIKSGAYKASNALTVLNDIEAALDAATDYGSLAVYVSGKLADANTAAGTQIFVSTGLLSQFTSHAVISECDKAIIKRHLANQRAIINALTASK